jgi:uncharacterized OB-fold protein
MTMTPASVRAPKPNNYTDTTEFWSGAQDGKLLVQFDRHTGQPQWFPRSVSLSTGRRDLEWREVSGNGTVYSWTVTRTAWPGHEHRVPYVCALIDLDEGVRILANLTNVDHDAITIGQPVRVVWQQLSGGTRYPAFEPR